MVWGVLSTAGQYAVTGTLGVVQLAAGAGGSILVGALGGKAASLLDSKKLTPDQAIENYGIPAMVITGAIATAIPSTTLIRVGAAAATIFCSSIMGYISKGNKPPIKVQSLGPALGAGGVATGVVSLAHPAFGIIAGIATSFFVGQETIERLHSA
jgi:hypothetical protein